MSQQTRMPSFSLLALFSSVEIDAAAAAKANMLTVLSEERLEQGQNAARRAIEKADALMDAARSRLSGMTQLFNQAEDERLENLLLSAPSTAREANEVGKDAQTLAAEIAAQNQKSATRTMEHMEQREYLARLLASGNTRAASIGWALSQMPLEDRSAALDVVRAARLALWDTTVADALSSIVFMPLSPTQALLPALGQVAVAEPVSSNGEIALRVGPAVGVFRALADPAEIQAREASAKFGFAPAAGDPSGSFDRDWRGFTRGSGLASPVDRRVLAQAVAAALGAALGVSASDAVFVMAAVGQATTRTEDEAQEIEHLVDETSRSLNQRHPVVSSQTSPLPRRPEIANTLKLPGSSDERNALLAFSIRGERLGGTSYARAAQSVVKSLGLAFAEPSAGEDDDANLFSSALGETAARKTISAAAFTDTKPVDAVKWVNIVVDLLAIEQGLPILTGHIKQSAAAVPTSGGIDPIKEALSEFQGVVTTAFDALDALRDSVAAQKPGTGGGFTAQNNFFSFSAAVERLSTTVLSQIPSRQNAWLKEAGAADGVALAREIFGEESVSARQIAFAARAPQTLRQALDECGPAGRLAVAFSHALGLDPAQASNGNALCAQARDAWTAKGGSPASWRLLTQLPESLLNHYQLQERHDQRSRPQDQTPEERRLSGAVSADSWAANFGGIPTRTGGNSLPELLLHFCEAGVAAHMPPSQVALLLSLTADGASQARVSPPLASTADHAKNLDILAPQTNQSPSVFSSSQDPLGDARVAAGNRMHGGLLGADSDAQPLLWARAKNRSIELLANSFFLKKDAFMNEVADRGINAVLNAGFGAPLTAAEKAEREAARAAQNQALLDDKAERQKRVPFILRSLAERVEKTGSFFAAGSSSANFFDGFPRVNAHGQPVRVEAEAANAAPPGAAARETPAERLEREIGEVRDWIENAEVGVWATLPEKPQWAAMARRAHEWHEFVVNQEAADKASKQWEPLLGEQSDGDYKAVELVNGGELHIEGKAMHHCVSSYADQCVKGQTRIFSILKNGERHSTLELSFEQDKIERSEARPTDASAAPASENKMIAEDALGNAVDNNAVDNNATQPSITGRWELGQNNGHCNTARIDPAARALGEKLVRKANELKLVPQGPGTERLYREAGGLAAMADAAGVAQRLLQARANVEPQPDIAPELGNGLNAFRQR